MRWARRAGLGAAAALVALIVAAVLTARPADPALWPPRPGEPHIEVFVVSHGWHSGLVLPLAAIEDVVARGDHPGHAALFALVQQFSGYRHLELGWGDEGFYRHVPDMGALTFGLAMRALLHPGNSSVVHVVGVAVPVMEAFPRADIVRIELTARGFLRMLAALEASFVREGDAAAQPLGPGLYGPSLFYRGTDTFHMFNVCNHWVARLLAMAGVPTAPVPATLPAGLLLDLRWRAGLVAVHKR
jgi:uncharacterized protein (TIGR02117 family)